MPSSSKQGGREPEREDNGNKRRKHAGCLKPSSEDTAEDGPPPEAGGDEMAESSEGEHQSSKSIGGAGGEGRTCVACRRSKVKCSRGLPCDRCCRLKLVCIAQVRGRGRPVASSTAAKRGLKPEHDKNAGSGSTGGGGGAGARKAPGEAAAQRREYTAGHSNNNPKGPNGDMSSPVLGGVLSSAHPSLSRPGSGGLPAAPASDGTENTSGGIGGGGGGSISSRRGDKRPCGGMPAGLSPGVSVPPLVSGTAGTTCQTPLGYAGPVSSVPDNGSGGGARREGLPLAPHEQQHLCAPSRPFPPILAGLPQQHQHPQEPQGYGAFVGARAFSHPLLHEGGGGSGSSGGGGGGSNGLGDGRGLMSPAARISSGGSWRAVYNDGGGGGGGNLNNGDADAASAAAVGAEGGRNNTNAANGQWDFMNAPLISTTARAIDGTDAFAPGHEGFLPGPTGHGMNDDVDGGGSEGGRVGGSTIGSSGRGKTESAFSSNGSFGGKGFMPPMWVETMDEHRDAAANAAAAAAAATAAGESGDPDDAQYLSKSTDKQARWLMDVARGASDTGGDSGERSPEGTRGAVDPTDTIVTGFWKLFGEQEVHRPKAVLVIRHWALCALDRRSTRLMRKTVDMARALSINVAEILNDYSIYAMFHELLQEAAAGNTIEPARPPAQLGHQEAPPYIQELSSKFAAVSMRVVLRGQSSFYHNDVCARLFLSTEEANELYAANKQDVWATCIHPDDHKPFFDSLSMQLFGAPGHQSEFRNIYKCRDHSGRVFLALVHFRYEFRDEGNYAAFGLSILPLPESDYLKKVESVAPAAAVQDDYGGSVTAGNGGGGGGSGGDSPVGQPQPSPSSPSGRSMHHSGEGGGGGGGGSSGYGGGGGGGSATSGATTLGEGPLSPPKLSSSSNSMSSTTSAPVAVGGGGGGGGGGGRNDAAFSRQPLPPLDLGLGHRWVGSFAPDSGSGPGPESTSSAGDIFSFRSSCSNGSGGGGGGSLVKDMVSESRASRDTAGGSAGDFGSAISAASQMGRGSAGLDEDSLNSSRGSVGSSQVDAPDGGGRVQMGGARGGGALESGPMASDWTRPSSRGGEMRMAGVGHV